MVALIIRIDRLEMKISDVSEDMVRQTITGFDKVISVQASELLKNKDLNILVSNSEEKLDVGNLYIHEKDIHPSQLQKTIANKILKSITGVREEESL